MENWLVTERRTKEREKSKTQGQEGIYSGQIIAVDSPDELMTISTHGGDKQYSVKHPYLALDSWIRVMPSPGAQAILQYRSDTSQPEVVNYSNVVQTFLQDQYTQDASAYRPIQPGELDLNSSGYTATYYSRRSVQDSRAGVIRSWLNQDEAEAGAKAPIHRRVLHQNVSSEMGDEERIGVVKRPKPGSSNFNFYPKYDTAYGKEYFIRVFSNNDTPTTLFEKWEGQVFDDDGTQTLQSATQQKLRLLHNYYANQGNPWTFEIDESGNSAITLPDSATFGHKLLIPQGNLYFQIGVNWESNVSQDHKLTVVQNSLINIGQDLTESIGGDMSTDVSGNQDLTVGGDQTNTISGDQTSTISGNQDNTISGNLTSTVDGSIKIETSAGAGMSVSSGGQVAFGNSTAELLSLLFQIFTALGTQTILTPVGPAAPIVASPQWSQVEQLLSMLQSITGSL